MLRERETMRGWYELWERLLACHSAFSLEKWLEQARGWGDTPQEKDYYEKCARLILTTWGGTGQLTDYANRQWCGMIGSYYRARWEMFWDEALASVREGRDFDGQGFASRLRQFELDWAEPAKMSITFPTAGNPVELAREVYRKSI